MGTDLLAEVQHLQMMQQYYLWSWMATMEKLNLMKESTLQSTARAHQVMELLQAGKISTDEALILAADDLHQWLTEYQEKIPLDAGRLN